MPATPETFFSYIHPDDRPAMVEAVSKIFEGSILQDVEYRIIRQDGKIRTIKQISKKITHPSGEELVSAIIQDITEQHATRSQLTDINEKLLLQNEAFYASRKNQFYRKLVLEFKHRSRSLFRIYL